MKFIKLTLAGIGMFIAFDLIWFQFSSDFFKSQVGTIARLTPGGDWDALLWPALIVYPLMALGAVVFVLPRASSVKTAALFGALFGFVGYGLYDLTNLATLTAWTIPFVAVDMTWGTVLCATVSAVLYSFSKLKYFA